MATDLEPQLAAKLSGVAVICRHFGVTTLEVFGSATSGAFNPNTSDYDFIAHFTPIQGDSLAVRYVGFSESLESLLGRPVEVLTDQHIANPYLRRAVDATRQPVYVESPAQVPA